MVLEIETFSWNFSNCTQFSFSAIPLSLCLNSTDYQSGQNDQYILKKYIFRNSNDFSKNLYDGSFSTLLYHKVS